MSEILETKTVKAKLWEGLITPQTVFLLAAGFASLVIFWNQQKNTTADVGTIQKELPSKADVSDLKSLEERVTRQYETNNKILERIIVLEKQQEYQRGIHDALQVEESKTKK